MHLSILFDIFYLTERDLLPMQEIRPGNDNSMASSTATPKPSKPVSF